MWGINMEEDLSRKNLLDGYIGKWVSVYINNDWNYLVGKFAGYDPRYVKLEPFRWCDEEERVETYEELKKKYENSTEVPSILLPEHLMQRLEEISDSFKEEFE